MGFVLLAIVLAIVLVVILGYKSGGFPVCDDDYDVETVTTTTTVSGPDYVGDLQRRREGAQCFVIDPADQMKIWVNDEDDRYEDAHGRIWRLR